ncbi:hypothetical protein CERZMDRAFT_102994 [Cercospora zeae-maydis SCOH1-5]|uniref:Uncharacterized protein n=1 Tax=Cercospora zeae-maydis SCOH1-5 TaxID=717836 RepID=A0A6A6EZF9_9PEZI|nr:hypothetical protein CERZMDRAFT_102994 [Cercospora zeae-maydis SCOH1-5]
MPRDAVGFLRAAVNQELASSHAQDPEPTAKAPKPPQKRLELIDDRIVLRDDLSNTSRSFPDEGLRHDVQIVQCEDRNCRKERRMDDCGVIVPDTGPPMIPSSNSATSFFV